jgi:hypothetical protein
MFEERKAEIEDHLLKNSVSILKQGFFLPELLKRGVISDFWSQSFRQNITKRCIEGGFKDHCISVTFSDLTIPTEIEPIVNPSKVKT